MPSTFNRLMSSLYRQPQEGEALKSTGVRRGRWFAFALLSLALVVPLVATLVVNIARWTTFAVDVEVPRSQWHALYESSPAPCGVEPDRSGRCLADPANPALWTSPVLRTSQDEHKAHVLARPGQEYWIGTTVTAAQAKRAFDTEANFLVVGLMRGTFRVWVDGVQMMTGDWLDSDPLVIQFPVAWLGRDRPVHIAIRCLRTTDINDAPDSLEENGRLGFVTKSQATDWRRHWSFWSSTRPLLFLGLNALLAWVFFAVWCVAPEKPEYFYIAVLSMCFGFYHLRHLDMIYLTTHRQLLNTLAMPTAVLHAFAVMLTGFAFARLRRSVMAFSLASCGAVCLFALLFVTDPIRQQLFAYEWLTLLADVGAAIGAATCFLQALHLYLNKTDRVNLTQRIKRLVVFGFGLLTLAAINRLWASDLAHDVLPTVLNIVIEKSGPFFLLLSLGITALSEFRTEHALAQAMPISRYHRLEPLPVAIHGVLLSVDLKDSETLSRAGAGGAKVGDVVETCLSHLWMAVTDNRGHVLRTEGDSLLALFPSDDQPDALAAAFAAGEAMSKNLGALERRFVSQGLKTLIGARGLRFRASVVEGEIRPIWQAYGGTRLAGWVEAGHSNAFIEAARLLELEREIAPGSSIIVISTALKSKLPASGRGGEWVFEDRVFHGKHGQAYQVAAYRVG